MNNILWQLFLDHYQNPRQVCGIKVCNWDVSQLPNPRHEAIWKHEAAFYWIRLQFHVSQCSPEPNSNWEMFTGTMNLSSVYKACGSSSNNCCRSPFHQWDSLKVNTVRNLIKASSVRRMIAVLPQVNGPDVFLNTDSCAQYFPTIFPKTFKHHLHGVLNNSTNKHKLLYIIFYEIWGTLGWLFYCSLILLLWWWFLIFNIVSCNCILSIFYIVLLICMEAA